VCQFLGGARAKELKDSLAALEAGDNCLTCGDSTVHHSLSK